MGVAMTPLYQARDRIEAQLLCDFLDRHLVASVVLGDYLSGAAGGLPVDICPTVWILDDDRFERGLELLALFHDAAASMYAVAAWTCSCGECIDGDFDLCWACGRPRPESAR
jgi:hypothetical protein